VNYRASVTALQRRRDEEIRGVKDHHLSGGPDHYLDELAVALDLNLGYSLTLTS
jgi:hypothetical protein